VYLSLQINICTLQDEFPNTLIMPAVRCHHQCRGAILLKHTKALFNGNADCIVKHSSSSSYTIFAVYIHSPAVQQQLKQSQVSFPCCPKHSVGKRSLLLSDTQTSRIRHNKNRRTSRPTNFIYTRDYYTSGGCYMLFIYSVLYN